MSSPLIIDMHLDLSMNAMEWNRDLRMSVRDINLLEQRLKDKPDRGNATVSLPALRKGNIGIVVATLIARYVKPTSALPGWNSPSQAWAQTQGQLSWYREMERQGHLYQITTTADLDSHLSHWQNNSTETPIGYLLSLEGADSIVSIDHLHKMYAQGLRAIGPAHYGPGTYAYGTDSDGSIGSRGIELLSHISDLDMILDVTHLSDTSFWETMDHYTGRLWASHSNCRALVPHNRQFNDEQIKAVIDRGGIIGMPLDAWMMIPNWIRGVSTPDSTGVSLTHMIDNIDHICQLTGSSNHVSIGTDLDGGFGKEQCPKEIDTIADLQLLPKMLEARGYSPADVSNILSGNCLRFLRAALD